MLISPLSEYPRALGYMTFLLLYDAVLVAFGSTKNLDKDSNSIRLKDELRP